MSDTIDDLVDDPVLRLRLQRHLERSADGVEIRRTPVTAVVRKADVRRRRQSAAAALGAVCLVVAAAGAVIAGRSDDRTIINVDEPPTMSTESLLPTSTVVAPNPTTGEAPTPPTTATPTDDNALAPITTAVSTIVDSPFDWQTITPDDVTRAALDFMVSSSYNDRGTLGWTYNESSPPDWVSTVYVSDDGITWAPTPTNPGLSVVGGIDTADAIHVVGYAGAADPDAGKVFLSTSDDRGTTWRRERLPFDLSPAWANDAVSVRLYPSELAAVDATIVVALQPMSMLLPAAFGTSMYTFGFVYLPNGVGVLRSCDGCPVGPLSDHEADDIERVIPWADLGVTEEAQALLRATPSVHVSGPQGYDEVEVAFANAPSGFWLTSTPTSILAVEQRPEPSTVGLLGAPARLYESTDGRSWRLVGEAPLQTGRAGRLDGRYVVVGADLETGDTAIASSIDGGSWTIHPLPPGTFGATWGPFYDTAALDDGMLAMAGFEVLEPPELRLTEGGVTMIFDAGLNDMQFIDDATGIEIGGARDGERYGPIRLDDGPTLSVLDEAGDLRAQFSLEEATAAMQSTPGPVQRVAIYTTDDLVTWSRTMLNDVVTDDNVSLNAVDLVDNRVIARVGVDRDGDPNTFETDAILLVGARTR